MTTQTPNGAAGKTRAQQAVTGVMPPQLGEARIREAWPTLVGVAPGLAGLGKALVRTWVLAPLGWLVQAPAFALKFAPFRCRRYTLTNRRLMVQRGLKPHMVSEVLLDAIDEVRCDPAKIDAFYLSGTLEVVSKGQVVLTLNGVPEPEGFRQAVLNAAQAWGRPVTDKPRGAWQAASEMK